MSAFLVLPSAAATWTPLRESATSMLVCASLNLRPPATSRKFAAEEAAGRAADAAGVALGEHDGRAS